MSDISDNLMSDQELLDILKESAGSVDTTSSADSLSSISSQDEEDANKKLSELQEIANKLTLGNSVSSGSGDIDTDLSNWFSGKDTLPSGDLTHYVSNANLKMDYGLTRNVMSSYNMMGKLRKFLEEDAFDALFTEQAIMGCDSEELESRVRLAFVMYKDLASLNAKINNDIKTYRIRSNNETSEIDKLALLLGSIPSDKLQSILSEIAFNKKEDNYSQNKS